MLELEVLPELGLASEQIEFLLGMHFSHAVAAIQSLVGTIKDVHILYCEKNALNVDLVINLTADGIRLVFDPVSQRLRVIEVHDMAMLKLRYSDTLFNCPEVSPTIEQIDQTFGATHPGVFDEEKHVFMLTFRGLSFEFPADTKFQPSYAGIRKKLGRLQFPPGESPRVSRMYIYSGASLSDSAPPPPPSPRYPALHADGGVRVLRGDRRTLGLRVRLSSVPSMAEVTASPPSSAGEDHPPPLSAASAADAAVTRDVLFGDSPADVASAIGAPARIFFKSEDKMKIHSPNARRKAQAQKSDYFYNYFTLGFDVLFDARTNTVKKFVLHTNYPGHYNFNSYHRCQFELPIYPETTSSSSREKQQQQQQYPISRTPVVFNAFSTWEEIARHIRPSDRPVVLNRASSANTTNPFGSTFCYGYQDIIFEVMPNGQLAGVTLYTMSANNNINRRAMLSAAGLDLLDDVGQQLSQHRGRGALQGLEELS